MTHPLASNVIHVQFVNAMAKLAVFQSEYTTRQLELYVFDRLPVCTFMTVLTQFMYVYAR